jgi:hypothetical protein
MDLDKKPGSRDGKPHKGTRRDANKANASHKPRDLIHLRHDSTHTSVPDMNISAMNPRAEPDAETGLLPGVTYSANKGKRWELVEQLKAREEADRAAGKERGNEGEEREDRSDVMVVELTNQQTVRGMRLALEDKPGREFKGKVKASLAAVQEYDRAQEKKEEPPETTEMVMTRKGPKPKKNVPKSKTPEEEPSAYDPQRLFVVVHQPSVAGAIFAVFLLARFLTVGRDSVQEALGARRPVGVSGLSVLLAPDCRSASHHKAL